VAQVLRHGREFGSCMCPWKSEKSGGEFCMNSFQEKKYCIESTLSWLFSARCVELIRNPSGTSWLNAPRQRCSVVRWNQSQEWNCQTFIMFLGWVTWWGMTCALKGSEPFSSLASVETQGYPCLTSPRARCRRSDLRKVMTKS
jgi:hypothetical protein